jgi:hypothetical protein
MAASGLTQDLQRKPSSAWEKAEVGFDKRPSGFQRNTIAYSPESAERLIETFRKALPPEAEVEFSTSEHEAGDREQSRAMATAMWAKVRDNDAMRANLGVAEDATDDEGVEACHAFLGGLRKPRTKKA